MDENLSRYMKISDIPEKSQKTSFINAFGTFLDHFYHHEGIRTLLIQDEPRKNNLSDSEYCLLAATAHKLANDYNLPVPQWVMGKEFIMPYDYYAFNTRNKEFQDALRATTPIEFSIKKLFMCSNVLSRA